MRPVTWWALACCGLVPILLPSAWLIAEALQPPSYDPIRQTVYEFLRMRFLRSMRPISGITNSVPTPMPKAIAMASFR